MLEKYIGDRAFLRRVLAVALPIMIQQAIMPFNAYTTSAYFTLRSGSSSTAASSGASSRPFTPAASPRTW